MITDARGKPMPEGFADSMRAVAWEARRMAFRGNGWYANADDVAQVGFEALVRVAARFDAGRGVPFGVYAMIRARGAMADYIRLQGGYRRKVRPQVVSLDDETGRHYVETLADDGWASDPEASAMMKAEAEAVEEAILGLEPRRREIIQQRRSGMKLRQIAQAHTISVTRAAELIWDSGRKVQRALKEADGGP